MHFLPVLFPIFLVAGCAAGTVSRDGVVRLVGGNSTAQGRVEIYHNGEWGTVCDDGWDMQDANVVCLALGFPGAISATKGGVFPSGSGPIMLDEVTCTGNESSLADCAFKAWKLTDCDHSEDAGVICSLEEDDGNSTAYTLDRSCEIGNSLRALFESQTNCDYFISVVGKDGGSTSKEIGAHRLILTLNPEADFLLRGEGSKFTLTVLDECIPQAKIFIRYFYTQKIKVTLSSLKCIHQMASTYKVSSLKEYTSQYFSVLISDDPSFKRQVELLNYADSSSDNRLRDLCLRYFAWNFESFSQSRALKDLQFEQLLSLLSRSDLVVSSEWAILEVLQDWLTTSRVEGELLKEMVESVRFPMMTPEELLKIQFNVSMYEKNKSFFQDKIIQALMFHSVSYQVLNNYVNLSTVAYTPRVYISSAWAQSVTNTPFYGYNYQYLNTPRQVRAESKSELTQWNFAYVPNIQTCYNYGFSCSVDSLPAFRLFTSNIYPYVNYRNMLLVKCDGATVTGMQEFQNDLASDPATHNSTGFPCSSGSYTYFVVVRPTYYLN
uniref:SRCR domain-containing protein n=1 Tax=Leptobrachium leishanense TaxID=445787 RepID=A0A8C5RBM2_9ANUR